MANIRVSEVDLTSASERLRAKSTKEWWQVIRVLLQAKAVRHFIEINGKKQADMLASSRGT